MSRKFKDKVKEANAREAMGTHWTASNAPTTLEARVGDTVTLKPDQDGPRYTVDRQEHGLWRLKDLEGKEVDGYFGVKDLIVIDRAR